MADTKTTAPAATTSTEVTSERFELDSKEVSRVLSVIRYRLNEGVRDANRARPFLSATQAEARAKTAAAFKVLKEFSENTF
jgi:hypothetical protein